MSYVIRITPDLVSDEQESATIFEVTYGINQVMQRKKSVAWKKLLFRNGADFNETAIVDQSIKIVSGYSENFFNPRHNS